VCASSSGNEARISTVVPDLTAWSVEFTAVYHVHAPTFQEPFEPATAYLLLFLEYYLRDLVRSFRKDWHELCKIIDVRYTSIWAPGQPCSTTILTRDSLFALLSVQYARRKLCDRSVIVINTGRVIESGISVSFRGRGSTKVGRNE
jgi:hypothetical protein